MKTVPFEKLTVLDTAITDIAVIYQTPQWNTIEMKSEGGRKLNGFLLIDSGECLYEWQEGSALLSGGSLIYLPSGSKHKVTVTGSPLAFYRISFNLTDAEDGKRVVFSNCPQVMTYCASRRMYDLAFEMMHSTVSRSQLYKSISKLSEFFHILTKQAAVESSKISPAVEYINRHYSENIDVGELAKMAFISKPHLFRLFKSELGMSPVEYRNYLRIERAKSLLADGELSVGEIASLLGFDGSYYFSRMFKEHTGMAPSKYNEG